MRLRPAAEIVLFGFAVLCFAHRAFCARLILRRAAPDMVRVPFELAPKAASASSMRWSCCCKCWCSRFNCWITADMCLIGTPGGMIARAGRHATALNLALGADREVFRGVLPGSLPSFTNCEGRPCLISGSPFLRNPLMTDARVCGLFVQTGGVRCSST